MNTRLIRILTCASLGLAVLHRKPLQNTALFRGREVTKGEPDPQLGHPVSARHMKIVFVQVQVVLASGPKDVSDRVQESGRSRKPLRVPALKQTTPGALWPGVSRELGGRQTRDRSLISPNVTVAATLAWRGHAVLHSIGSPRGTRAARRARCWPMRGSRCFTSRPGVSPSCCSTRARRLNKAACEGVSTQSTPDQAPAPSRTARSAGTANIVCPTLPWVFRRCSQPLPQTPPGDRFR
jgi:hypothetical protein